MSINGFPDEYNNVISPSYIVAGDSVVLTNERVLTAGSGISISDAGPGGALTVSTTGLASNSESFLVLGNSANLSGERVITAGTGISFTDAGANSTLTINNTSSGFNTVAVSNFGVTQSNLVADSIASTLAMLASTNMNISTIPGTDTLVFEIFKHATTVGSNNTVTLSASSATIQGGNTSATAGTGALTFNLPLAASCPGKIFIFHQNYPNAFNNVLTIARSGSDTITNHGVTNATSITVDGVQTNPYEAYTVLVSDGVSLWHQIMQSRFGVNSSSTSSSNMGYIDFGFYTADTTNTSTTNRSDMIRYADNTTGDLTYTLTASPQNRKMHVIRKNQPNAKVLVAPNGRTIEGSSSSLVIGSSGSIGDTVWMQYNSGDWKILARTDLHKWAHRVNTSSFTAEYGASHKVSTAGGAVTCTLPTAVNRAGEVIRIKLRTAGNTLTINTTSSETMDGATSGSITSSTQYHYIEFESDGANWMIFARNFS